MAFPVTARTTGTLITATIWNSDIKDNLTSLYAGAMSIAGQAANDDIYAASSTQLGVAGRQLRETFRGLRLRTHPDADLAASKVYLDNADEIVMHDGTRVASWSALTADVTASGAGGLDTGSEGASRWYEIYAIRKSSDGTKKLLLHRAKDYLKATSFETSTSDSGVSPGKSSDPQTKGGQSFQVSTGGPLAFADIQLGKVGTPSGKTCWLTIEADSGGNPSGTPLATSDALDCNTLASYTANAWVRFIFRSPYTISASTTYWLVLNTTASSATDYINWRALAAGGYTSGSAKYKDATTWNAYGTADLYFKVFVTENDTAVTMPSGYDQRALIGYVYNDSGSNFKPFLAFDRAVTMNSGSVGTFATTLQVLTDLSAFVPPLDVYGFILASGSAIDDTLNVAPLDLSGSAYRHSITVPTASRYYSGPPAPIQAQAAYFQNGNAGGTLTAYLKGFQW